MPHKEQLLEITKLATGFNTKMEEIDPEKSTGYETMRDIQRLINTRKARLESDLNHY